MAEPRRQVKPLAVSRKKERTRTIWELRVRGERERERDFCAGGREGEKSVRRERTREVRSSLISYSKYITRGALNKGTREPKSCWIVDGEVREDYFFSSREEVERRTFIRIPTGVPGVHTRYARHTVLNWHTGMHIYVFQCNAFFGFTRIGADVRSLEGNFDEDSTLDEGRRATGT